MAVLVIRRVREPWVPPPVGLVKLNVDGAVSAHRGRGSAAVVCRDHSGRYLGASAVVFEITDPNTLETLACREALALATNLNEQHLFVASDCRSVVKDIADATGGSNGSIVRD